MPIIKKLLGHKWEWCVFWNQDFDVPKLRAENINITAPILDAMWLFHWFQPSLPKSLGFASSYLNDMREWKSLGSLQPEFYSCLDSAVTFENAERLIAAMRESNQWDVYLRHQQELDPILKEMGESGILLDLKAQDKFRKIMEQQREKGIEKVFAVLPPRS